MAAIRKDIVNTPAGGEVSAADAQRLDNVELVHSASIPHFEGAER
jgi:hypothetical protein